MTGMRQQPHLRKAAQGCPPTWGSAKVAPCRGTYGEMSLGVGRALLVAVVHQDYQPTNFSFSHWDTLHVQK